MTTKRSTKPRVEREARLRWVPIDKMIVNPLAQRELNQSRVDYLAANLDLEQIGNPTLNHREGNYYVIDGQHRIEALRQFGFESDSLQCWVYDDLSSEDEADRFLKLNDALQVQALPKFHAAVHAGREVECDIDRIVRSNGLVVSRHKVPGAIGAVGTLRRVYKRGPEVLSRTLGIVRDAYGDAGLEAPVLDGIGHLCARYNGELDSDRAVTRLSEAHGGVNGLLNRADVIKRQTGNGKGLCVAAAAVETINKGRGGKKLPDWWKS